MLRSFRRLLPLLVLAASFTAARADTQGFVPDDGVYHVYQNGQLLGDEHITFEQHSDTLVVMSLVGQRLPRPGAVADTLFKSSTLVLGMRDHALRGYTSYEQLNGDALTRALSMSDTTYTSYRQTSTGGFGDTFSRPPGRIYIVDPQVFVMFDVLCRDMHAQKFDERRITLLYVTARDTAVDGRVKRLGKGPIRLGGQTIAAEKFSITDPWSEFLVWVASDGRMLRLGLPAMGLRVDRDPETLKPHAVRNVPAPHVGLPVVNIAEGKPAPAPARVSSDSLPPPPAR